MYTALDLLLFKILKRVADDPVATRLANMKYGNLDYIKKQKVIDQEKDRLCASYKKTYITLYVIAAIIAILGSLPIFIFGIDLVFLAIPLTLGVLFALSGYLTYRTLDTRFKLTNFAYLNFNVIREFPAEYKELKRGAHYAFTPSKAIPLSPQGEENGATLFIDELMNAIRITQPGSDPLVRVRYKSITGYKVLEDNKAVFSSKRGSYASGVSYFGIEPTVGTPSKDDVCDSESCGSISFVLIYLSSSTETEYTVPVIKSEISRDSEEYKNAVQTIYSAARELEFIINRRKTPKGA